MATGLALIASVSKRFVLMHEMKTNVMNQIVTITTEDARIMMRPGLVYAHAV
jgi:hypothetical protein